MYKCIRTGAQKQAFLLCGALRTLVSPLPHISQNRDQNPYRQAIDHRFDGKQIVTVAHTPHCLCQAVAHQTVFTVNQGHPATLVFL